MDMKILKKIKELFGKKEKPVPFVGALPPVEALPKVTKSIPLSKKDKRNNRVKAWQSKTIKKKANRLPLAKMMNPDKYF